jgi:hypothetical protein
MAMMWVRRCGRVRSRLIATPNIDRLAAKGLQFTDGHCPAANLYPIPLSHNDPVERQGSEAFRRMVFFMRNRKKLGVQYIKIGLIGMVFSLSSQGEAAFFYADTVESSGGQFDASYSVSNLMNNGFTDPSDIISTAGDYIAKGNNYATASGTTADFDLVFGFASPTAIDGMHVWNYVYRNGSKGTASTNSGVNAYSLMFYDGAAGTGSVVGSLFTGSLQPAVWNADNAAESIDFDTTYSNVQSVVMQVISNQGGSAFAGMNELAFNGPGAGLEITAFSAAAPFAQRPDPIVLNWVVTGVVTSVFIEPNIGDVTALTTNGVGRVEVLPLGEETYTLTLNGSMQERLSVVGLPPKEQLHLYLLIGQSNMAGVGSPYSAALDAPDPRVIKFGSRDGMEQIFVKGGHPLTTLGSSESTSIGMGVEFGKTMLSAQSDTNVVIGLINHARGTSAIQWWAPGVLDNKQINPDTGLNYYLYDEAIQRVQDARQYGVLKGVLWHQGEYNSNNNTNPDSEPELYAARLQALVDNLRTSFDNPALPFVCGKLVPAEWTYENGDPGVFTGLPHRSMVEAALMDLPNQRSNTYGVDNDGLRGRSDQLIHFDAYSQRLLGQRYAAAMLAFYNDPYLLYLGGYLSPAQLQDAQLTDPLEDNDHDGRVNYLEYAFRYNPMEPDYASPLAFSIKTVSEIGDVPTVSFKKRTDTEAPGYAVCFSTNLVSWTRNAVVEMEESPFDHGDGSATVRVRPEGLYTHGFFRLRVEPK